MLAQVTGDGRRAAILLLFAGAIGLLVCVMAAARLCLSEGDPSPSRRALIHWLPMGILGLVAAAMGHPELSLGLAFGTSVAALSTVLGFVILAGPLEDAPPPWVRRVWSFLPVPVLLVFLLGFGGTVGLFEAAIMALQGVLVLLVWTDRSPSAGLDERARWVETAWAGSGREAEAIEPGEGRRCDRAGRRLGVALWPVAALAIAAAVAAVSAWAATRGAEKLNALDPRYPLSVMGATLLSVVLIMPMVSTGVPVAATGRGWAPITAQVGVVYLNLGVLLPAAILLSSLVSRLGSGSGSGAATQPVWQAVLYPRIAWRIDAVAMLILSLLFVPVSAGKMRFGRVLGACLIFGYCLYLLYVLARGWR